MKTFVAAGVTTEAQIHEAARTLFNRRGYLGMTLRRIAHEVGIEPQSIYSYTSSKQDLVDRMMRMAMSALRARVTGAMEQADPTPSARLHAAVRAHTRYFCAQDDSFMVVRDALEHLDPETRAAQLQILHEYEGIFRTIIGEGVATGEFDVTATTPVVYAVMGLGESILHWYKPGGPLSADQLSHQYADLALRMVRGRGSRS